MNLKHLLTLLVATVLLGAVYFLVNRASNKPNIPPEVGMNVLAGVDLNATTSLSITDAATTLEILRDDSGVWRVPSLANYPADFDRLARRLRDLADVKISDVLRGMTLDPATTITLRGNSLPLATLHLGQARQSNAAPAAMMWQPPEGRYLRLGDNEKIYLVKEDLGEFTTNPRAWVDTQILAIQPNDIFQITIKYPENEPSDFYRVSGSFTMQNLVEGETLDTSKIHGLESVFSRLQFVNVLPESTPDSITGLSTGIVFNVALNNAMSVIAQVGNAAPDGNRYACFVFFETCVPVEFSGDLDDSETRNALIHADNARLSPYIFTIPAHLAETMTRPRSYFLLPPETPPALVSDPVFIGGDEADYTDNIDNTDLKIEPTPDEN
jgi:hypothetical protein